MKAAPKKAPGCETHARRAGCPAGFRLFRFKLSEDRSLNAGANWHVLYTSRHQIIHGAEWGTPVEKRPTAATISMPVTFFGPKSSKRLGFHARVTPSDGLSRPPPRGKRLPKKSSSI
ncbi:hypothetical protein HPB50_003789 [Hyalomma asiaticum]|uniref:Uncharacterized protein n=1 Tax=Hyalomma asiaticum TaxID=266040 RepID=A0ACB7S4F2_HYAAI|nr:hypothetical protein HPB50_003789 [Hyalomma asiaticum]